VSASSRRAFTVLAVLVLRSAGSLVAAVPPLSGTLPRLDPQGRRQASYEGANGVLPASGTATTTVGGSTFDVNSLLGADQYYGLPTPITGQNTVTTNLEAGFFWNGHEALQHVATNTSNFSAGTESWGGTSLAAKYDAHATWAAMLIGGRQTAVDPEIRQLGIAPDTGLRSAAIASAWLGNSYATSFDFTVESFLVPYQATFGTADVVNSSWGFTPDSAGVNEYTVVMDAYPYENPTTTYVVSAGNAGPTADTVGSPGTGYNGITVAALGGANAFTTVAGFSSRGPADFGYRINETQAFVVPDVRAVVDIAAPGDQLVSALYGGQNGGNNTTLPNSTDYGSIPDAYSAIGGTSFSAPIVAGGAALVVSAAKTLPSLSANAEARQSVVVKSLLLTGSDKTSGWSNGQQVVTVGSDTFTRTTQSLDWATGAGRMNLGTTLDLQLNGQRGVAGTSSGPQGPISAKGWDFGGAIRGTSNDYPIAESLIGNTTFTASLSWLRVRLFDFATTEYADLAQADLNLSVWERDSSGAFTTLIARSESLYNTVEHLSFALPRSGLYGLRVEYPLNTFDLTDGAVWGNASFPQEYGVSWQAVPEPASLTAAAVAGGLLLVHRRRVAG